MEVVTTYSKSVVVYLASAVVQGALVSNHERLSDFLNSRGENEVVPLQDVKVEDLRGRVSPLSPQGIIFYVHQVLFAVDRGEVAHESLRSRHYVNRDPRQVIMGIGPYWLQGAVHLIPGGELRHFVEGKTRFIPMTDATLMDDKEIDPRTFLINREKVDWVIAN